MNQADQDVCLSLMVHENGKLKTEIEGMRGDADEFQKIKTQLDDATKVIESYQAEEKKTVIEQLAKDGKFTDEELTELGKESLEDLKAKLSFAEHFSGNTGTSVSRGDGEPQPRGRTMARNLGPTKWNRAERKWED